MYIAPNSVIKIYRYVPLDPTYNHTLFFQNLENQLAYFHSNQTITKYVLSAQSYQRVVKEKMRIAIEADNLYDCNYLAFQNTAFGSKWFYAFITDVEYVNNETSEITFEIDVMQTYMFDVLLRECFVEREHSITDVAGDNIVAENVDIGDIICADMAGTNHFDSYKVVICKAPARGYDPNFHGYIAGLFTGCIYLAFDVNSQTDTDNALSFLYDMIDANEQDSVVSVFMMPSDFFTGGTMPSVLSAYMSKNTQLQGYTPRNKKLLTYPYNYLGVDCGNNSAVYRYEWFDDDRCDFALVGTVTPNPQIALVPQNYNGVSNDHFNYVEKLVMDGFPQVAWCIDAFRAWLAQEASGVAIQGLAGLASMFAGAGTVNPVAFSAGGVGVANTVNTVVHASLRPNQARGTNAGQVDVATRTKNFYFRRMQITAQYARIIDDFFDMYGYATQRVKVPNRSSRPHWNYVKTKDCIVTNLSAPSDDVKKICGIYNKGITFWKDASEVGNYSLNNAPT